MFPEIEITPERDHITTPYGVFKRTYSKRMIELSEEDGENYYEEDLGNDYDIYFNAGNAFKFKLRKFDIGGDFKVVDHISFNDISQILTIFSKLHQALAYIERKKLSCLQD